ncbi:MAG TPA: hypothetical protein VFE63_04145 [Roseiarcus sp.]|nr:hypothetical protein [Roseiarcus sp.]
MRDEQFARKVGRVRGERTGLSPLRQNIMKTKLVAKKLLIDPARAPFPAHSRHLYGVGAAERM